jgi:pyruvate/2-oxoglutarate dehydrogenase complex dihydrolipoamide acyltransferase (E2) component
MSSVEILVPDLPESVADATVATWHKKPGDTVQRDEVIVEIETDKVVLEVPASEAGILDAIVEEEGATVLSRQLLGRIRPGDSSGKPTAEKSQSSESTPASASRLPAWKKRAATRSGAGDPPPDCRTRSRTRPPSKAAAWVAVSPVKTLIAHLANGTKSRQTAEPPLLPHRWALSSAAKNACR